MKKLIIIFAFIPFLAGAQFSHTVSEFKAPEIRIATAVVASTFLVINTQPLNKETQGKVDRIEAAGLEFHQAVRNGFLTLADAEPTRIKVLNADQNQEELHQQIVDIITDVVK